MVGLLFFGMQWDGRVIGHEYCSAFEARHPQTHEHLLLSAAHCMKSASSPWWSWYPEGRREQSIGLWVKHAEVLRGQDVIYWNWGRGRPGHAPVITQSWPMTDETITLKGYPGSSTFQSIECQYRGIRMDEKPNQPGLWVRIQLECPAQRYQGLSGGLAIRENGEVLGVLVGGNMSGFRPAQELLVEPLWLGLTPTPLTTEVKSSVYQDQWIRLKTLGAQVLSYEVRTPEGLVWAAWQEKESPTPSPF